MKIESKHGESIVKRLSQDLKSKYPDLGVPVSNLWRWLEAGFSTWCKSVLHRKIIPLNMEANRQYFRWNYFKF